VVASFGHIGSNSSVYNISNNRTVKSEHLLSILGHQNISTDVEGIAGGNHNVYIHSCTPVAAKGVVAALWPNV